MTVNLAPVPVFRAFDGNGNPLAGGKLYSYEAGTTTPKATYTSSTGLVQNTNPVLLDANGQAAVWLGSGNYKLSLESSAGVLQPGWPVDGIPGDRAADAVAAFAADLANTSDVALGDALVGVKQPYTGASARTQHQKNAEFVSVLDFGADPTGTAESTSAFTDALSTGKRVYAPAGTYKVHLSLLSNDIIFGDGMRRTILIPVAGQTEVILIDASTVAKQNVCLSDLCIKNPNNVANCAGIWFKGDNVLDINDQHNLTNIEIGPVGWEGTTYAFLKGVKVTGRLISVTAINLWCSGNTVGWHSVTDPSTPAFNGCVFINCVFQNNVQQGFFHNGQSTNITFIEGYTQNNNTGAAAGIAGIDFSDPINLTFEGHGFEGNGPTVPVNAGVPTSNSISLLIQGSICQNLMVRNGYFTSSGANIVLGASINTLVGGCIEGNYLNCLTNGFNFANLAQGGSNYAEVPLVLCANNNFNGQISVYTAGIGQQVVARQSQAIGYLTAAQTLDLLKVSTIVTNPSVTLAITTINNRIPGCELEIMNVFGSASVTIDGALMVGGGLATVTSGTIGRFKVLGGPYPGLLYRMS